MSATKLNTLTEPQLLARIDQAKADAKNALRLHDMKAVERHEQKAAKLGRVLAEVRTGTFFLGGEVAPQRATSGAGAGESEETYHPMLDGPAEPVGLAMPADDADALPTEAGDQARPWAKGMRKLIHAWLLNHGPATTTEVCKGLGKMPWSVRPRFSDLVSIGAILDTGEKRSETGRGNTAVVWKAI